MVLSISKEGRGWWWWWWGGGGGGEGVRKGAVQILLSSSSITTNKSPLTRHNGIKPTKGREGVDKRLPAVDALIPFVV